MTNFRSHSKLVAESELELKLPGAQAFFSHLSMVRTWEVARGQNNVPVCAVGTRQLCPRTGPKIHSFYVKKVGRQPLLQPERKGAQGSWRWEAGGGAGPRFSPCAIWKKALGNFLQVGPRPPACEGLRGH